MGFKVLARARITSLSAAKALTDGVDGSAAAVPVPGPKAISGTASSAGLISITATAHGYNTGNQVTISSVVGTTEANSTWIIDKVDANTFTLRGSAFVNAYVSGGVSVRERDRTVGVLLQAAGKDILYTDDGTVPTATIGMKLSITADNPTPWFGNLSSLKFIESAASATLEITYIHQ